MFITIDPYYTNVFYNECREALKNNGVEFTEYISVKPPFHWYFKIDRKPIMLNYDEATESELRWLVKKVQALKPNDEYLLNRRENDGGGKAILKFIENAPLRAARQSDYAVFFNVKNREALESLTKEYPGKVWYMGKYYNNRFRVCLATHRAVKGFLDDGQILLEKTSDMKEPGRFEAELNWKVLRLKDALIKFTETPYFEKGIFKRPNFRGDVSSRFTI